MLMTSVRLALSELFDPALRAVFWKSIGLTIAGLVLIWLLLRSLFEALAVPFVSGWFATTELPWLAQWGDGIGIIALFAVSVVMAVLAAFLIGPVSAAIAGIFLDDVAEHIEGQDYPDDPVGKPLPLMQSVWMSLRFFGVVIFGNLVALALLLVPGINLVAFFAVNGYLLGREYFQFAALRYHDEQTVNRLRSQHSTTILLGGFAIAAMLAVPVANLLTPLFGACLMVHLHKAIARRSATT